MSNHAIIVRNGRSGPLRTKLEHLDSSGYITAVINYNKTKREQKISTHPIRDDETPTQAIIRLITDYQAEQFQVESMSEDLRSESVVMDIPNPDSCKQMLAQVIGAFHPQVIVLVENGESFTADIDGLTFNFAFVAKELESVSTSFWKCAVTPMQAALLVAIRRFKPAYIDQNNAPFVPPPALLSTARDADIDERVETRLGELGIIVRQQRLRVDPSSPMSLLAGI
jgi:hypothetical protein